MTPEDQNRSDFEAWMKSDGRGDGFGRARFNFPDVGLVVGDYLSVWTQSDWETWQASRINYRASVLEEAAMACEDISDEYGDREGGKWPELKSDAQSGAKACENAIRALASQTAKEG